MRNLFSEVIDDILSPGAEIGDILRKANVIAYKISSSEFKKWVESELNGYNPKDELPDYRRYYFESQGNFYGLFGAAIKNGGIPRYIIDSTLGKEEHILSDGMRDSIGAIEHLLNSGLSNHRRSWPTDLIMLFQSKGVNIYQDYRLAEAWQTISDGTLKSIIESVKTSLMSFLLELEQEYPLIRDNFKEIGDVPRLEANKIFISNIYGSNNQMAISERDVSQFQINDAVTKNDFDSLSQVLATLGLSSKLIEDLENAINADDTSENNKLGKEVSSWLGNAAIFLTERTIEVSIGVIVNAISSFYGIN